MRQVSGVAHGRAEEFAAANDDRVTVHFNRLVQPAMHGIILQEVGIGGHGAEVVDGDDFDVLAVMLDDGTQNETANAAKTIDCNANGHERSPLERQAINLLALYDARAISSPRLLCGFPPPTACLR